MAISCLIDASVAAKWFLPEIGSDRAALIAETDEPLWAPDLIVPEIANILWRACRSGRATPDDAAAAMTRLLRFFDTIIPSAELASAALAISLTLDHAAYDCFYVAAAEEHQMRLVTADARLCDRVKGTTYGRYVELL